MADGTLNDFFTLIFSCVSCWNNVDIYRYMGIFLGPKISVNFKHFSTERQCVFLLHVLLILPYLSYNFLKLYFFLPLLILIIPLIYALWHHNEEKQNKSSNLMRTV